MDYQNSFAISASGMAVERLRLDVTAVNLANLNSTAEASGSLFKPLRVVSGQSTSFNFSQALSQVGNALGGAGVEIKGLETMNTPPRLVLDPGHPMADAKGFVAYPGINHLSEMMTMGGALRAYEANLAAFQASRTMAQRALEIGGQ